MAKFDAMEAGVMVLGAAGGAAVSRYGSNAISNSLTKDEPQATQTEIRNIAIWRKAPFWDIVLGASAYGVGEFAVKGSSKGARAGQLALKSGGVYLVANGVLDLVGDMMTPDTDARQVNGRPLAYTGEGAARHSVGALRRNALSRPYAQRLNSQSFVPSQRVGGTAIY